MPLPLSVVMSAYFAYRRQPSDRSDPVPRGMPDRLVHSTDVRRMKDFRQPESDQSYPEGNGTTRYHGTRSTLPQRLLDVKFRSVSPPRLVTYTRETVLSRLLVLRRACVRR